MKRFRSCYLFLSAGLVLLVGLAQGQSGKPAHLQVDSLVEPLGIDSPKPVLSWQLRDGARGARQTAYQVMVFSKQPSRGVRADLWDSGKQTSDVSNGIAYGGPALQPGKRYFWRVEVWGVGGKRYPVSDASWWETGLMTQASWRGQWIGHESAELHAIRESHAIWITNAAGSMMKQADTHSDYRFHFALDQAVAQAVLYTTGQDTAAAWLNDISVMKAAPLVAWNGMPWGTYARQDVTSAVRRGDNLLAIGITRYRTPGGGGVPTRTPMSMCLWIRFADGSTVVYSSASPGWKAAVEAPERWWASGSSDAAWKPAEPFGDGPDNFGAKAVPSLPWPTGPVAALRRSFLEPKAVVSARLYATALGAYKFRINGEPVGDQILAPGWMDFREHVPYQVYDVTRQIHSGSNVIAAYLAPGWYSTPLEWARKGNNYGGTEPALKAQLRLEHADGTVDWIATDASWKAETSPILQAEIYDGETRDARNEMPGWDAPGFDDGAWQAASLVTPKEPLIVAQSYPPIHEEQVLLAKNISQPKPGVYVFDFGQNMSALPKLQVRGTRGDNIRLRFAEVLNPDGTLYTDNLRTAKATDHFILAGKGLEVYEPLFTFHGFRYAEITGLKTAATLETLKSAVLHTDASFTMRFSTGDAMVNKLWSNILWGQRSNFIGVPTDCPQRDERLGWSADAQVFWRTATFNMDLTTFSQKYAGDLRGTQAGTAMYGIFAPGVDTSNPGFGAAWSDAGVIVPWTGWIQSGNKLIIEENWAAMESYLAEIARNNPNHLWQKNFGAAFGDWLTPTITTPEDLLATAYWAYDVSLMRQMALATGRTETAARYAAEFELIRAAFAKAYVRGDGFVGTVDHYPSIPPPTLRPEAGGKGEGGVVETQTGYVLALYMGLVPDELRKAAADRLVKKIEENHGLLGTGFLGTPYLLAVLADTGHTDLAYKLLLNREYPSWGYLIEHGATTTWERWNGDTMRNDPSMNSYNHYAYGAVAEWLYRYGAGIDTAAGSAGFKVVDLHPNFDRRLGHLSLDYDSTYGTIHSGWTVAGDRVSWTVTIPPNASAVLDLRKTNASGFRLDGVPIAESNSVKAEGAERFSFGSGTYAFTAGLGAVGVREERADARR